MVVLQLLCFTSLLTLAASNNFGLSDELASSYRNRKSIDVLKEEIAKAITPKGSLNVDVTNIVEDKLINIICTVSNIQLTHRVTAGSSEGPFHQKTHLMTYNLKMDAEVMIYESVFEKERKTLEFEDSNAVFTVISAQNIELCFVLITDVKFNYGSPKGVTQDEWSDYMKLLGTNLEDQIKALMQNTLGNGGWICGTIPIAAIYADVGRA